MGLPFFRVEDVPASATIGLENGEGEKKGKENIGLALA
jgi:hypothetical protein